MEAGRVQRRFQGAGVPGLARALDPAHKMAVAAGDFGPDLPRTMADLGEGEPRGIIVDAKPRRAFTLVDMGLRNPPPRPA